MFIVGYVTEEEAIALLEQGWQFEQGEDYAGLVGEEHSLLPSTATPANHSIVVVTINKTIPAALRLLKEKDSTKLLKLDEYAITKLRLESELQSLKRRCAHQYADGTSMIAPSPYGQGETYCPNCGNKWD